MAAHDRHAAIQVREAELERALARAHDPTDCDLRADGVAEADAAAAGLCGLASGARDADAAVRCERATRRARDAREALDATCA